MQMIVNRISQEKYKLSGHHFKNTNNIQWESKFYQQDELPQRHFFCELLLLLPVGQLVMNV